MPSSWSPFKSAPRFEAQSFLMELAEGNASITDIPKHAFDFDAKTEEKHIPTRVKKLKAKPELEETVVQ